MNICPICNKTFNYNYLLKRHFNSKRKCIIKIKKENIDKNLDDLNKKLTNLNNIVLKNDISYENDQCLYCYKIYSNRSNLKTHIKSKCKFKNKILDQIKEVQLEIKNYKPYVSQQPIQITNNKNVTNNIINNNLNINNLNNITNNNVTLTINPFGQEDLSHITLKDYKKYLSGFFPGFIEYIKKIHYADEMPSNHNIYISNLNSKYAYVYKDDKWNVEKKEALVDNIVSKKMLLLDSKCDELEKEGLLTDKIVHNHESFEINYKNGGEESEKYLADDVMLLMYNNRDKIERIKTTQDIIKI
jgi:hypothetical protein